jgi:hypothetical protein
VLPVRIDPGRDDGAARTWPEVVEAAVAECAAVVLAGSDADWSAQAGRLDWDCRDTLLHSFSPQRGPGSSWHALLEATGRVPDEGGAFLTAWRWRNTGT